MNRFFLAVVLLAIFTNHVQANNQFKDFFNSFDRLSADFKQTTHNEFNVLIGTTSGTLSFNRPTQLRWHTTFPNEQILLLNNNELWLVDIELEQATLERTTDLTQTPLYWLINKPDQIENTPIFSHTENNIDWYKTTKKTNFILALLITHYAPFHSIMNWDKKYWFHLMTLLLTHRSVQKYLN